MVFDEFELLLFDHIGMMLVAKTFKEDVQHDRQQAQPPGIDES